MIVPHCQKDPQPDSGRLQHSLNLVLADRFHQYPEIFKLKAIMFVLPDNKSSVLLEKYIVLQICRLIHYSTRTVKEGSKM
jgi:hypothetical protein